MVSAVQQHGTGLQGFGLPSRQTCPHGRSPWRKGAAMHPALMDRSSSYCSRAMVTLGDAGRDTGDLPRSVSCTLQPLTGATESGLPGLVSPLFAWV